MRLGFFKSMLAAACLLGLGASMPSLEAAGGGVKYKGMARAGVAYAQDPFIGTYNPGGIGFICDSYASGFELVFDDIESTVVGSPVPGANGSYEGNLNLYPNFDGAIVKQMPCDFAVGIAAYNFGHLETKYSTGIPLVTATNEHLRFEVIQETLSPMIAYRFLNCHSVGLSLDFNVQELKVRGIDRFATPAFSNFPGNVNNNGRDYSFGLGVSIGYLGYITDKLSVGINYKPKVSMSRLHKYQGFLADRGKLDLPQVLAGGFAYRILPCVNVIADVEWIDYRHIRSLNNTLHFPPTSADDRLGGPNGTGFGWRSRVLYRIGADWAINDSLTVRAGYRYARTPLVDTQTFVNALSAETIEHYATIGATWEFRCGKDVSFYYAHGFENTVNGQRSIPATLGGGNVNLKASQNVVGFAFSSSF